MIVKSQVGIRDYHHVEFYVGSAKMVAYWFAKGMGFSVEGYLGPETGVHDRCSYYLVKNKIRIMITSPLHPEAYDIEGFIQMHGDGVKGYAVEVDNVRKAFDYAVKHRAVPVKKPHFLKDKSGRFDEASLKLYDDTEVRLVNADHYNGIFKPGFGKPLQKLHVEAKETGLYAIDHIVGNVRENEMDFWADYFNNAFDFETYIEFGPGDITTKYSSLLSKVVRAKDSVIKNPINEPYKGVLKSQIEEFIDEYRGSGIQHIAISTPDIISSIRAMRANGIELLEVPDTYYKNLKERKLNIKENIDDLQKLGILCDYDLDGKGYLLQLFTKPIGDRPTFFFEIIQRRGSEGFGQGNFQALFEAIEEDQIRRLRFKKKR